MMGAAVALVGGPDEGGLRCDILLVPLLAGTETVDFVVEVGLSESLRLVDTNVLPLPLLFDGEAVAAASPLRLRLLALVAAPLDPRLFFCFESVGTSALRISLSISEII